MRKLATLVAAGCCVLGASAAPANADPTPFGHACTAQNGVRFCPTARLDQRAASFDNLPIDVDVTLPASGNGPFPTIVLLHRPRRRQDDVPGHQSRRQQRADVPLQQRLLRAAGLRRRDADRTRLRQLVRRRVENERRLRERLDAARRQPLRGARRADAARQARRPRGRRPGGARRDRRLLRRRRLGRAGLPEGPRAAARRRLHRLEKPGGDEPEIGRGLPALGLGRARHGADPERSRRRHRRPERETGLLAARRREALVHDLPLPDQRARRDGLLPRRRPAVRSDELVRPPDPGRAVHRQIDRRRDLGLPVQGHDLDPGRAGADADRERLDRRALHRPAGRRALQPGARRQRDRRRLADAPRTPATCRRATKQRSSEDWSTTAPPSSPRSCAERAARRRPHR